MRPAGLSIDELLAHGGWLRGLARSLVRDASTADDVVQDAWLRAIERPPRDRAALACWLGAVVRNLARDAGRRDARRAAREASAARPEGTPAAADLVARAEAQRRLLDAVVALDEPFRTVVLLRFFEDLPPREIARRTGVPAATVRTRLHRALAELRARLGEDGDARAIVALAGALPALRAASAKAGAAAKWGGLVVSTKQKLALVLVLLACAAGGAVWSVTRDGAPPEGPSASSAADVGAAPAAPRPRVRAAAPARAGTTSPAPAAVAPKADDPPAPRAAADPVRTERLDVTVVRFLEPRAAPAGVTEIREGERPVIVGDDGKGVSLGGAGGMRPVGWSRWHPVPAKGKVTWSGRVVDVTGAPVAGADVYRVELDASGGRASPSSFQWVARAATTGADGTFTAKEQPDGAFLVAANLHGRMNRARGLDLAASRRVEAHGEETVAGLEVVLPFDVASLGGVRGVVLDEDGKPVKSASVSCGMQAPWTDAAGRFELLALDPGDVRVGFRGTGFAARTETFAVTAGVVRDVEVRLELASKGTLEIAGRVLDEDGAPVPNVPLFLSDGSRDGARWATADAEGRYRFANLADALATRGADVMVSPHPDRDMVLGAVKKGVRPPEPALDFVVRRLVWVTVHLRSSDGTPISLFNLEVHAERPGEAPRQLHSMSAYEEDGTTRIRAPKGRLVIGVEGKGHRPMEVAVDVPDTASPKEIVIEMQRE